MFQWKHMDEVESYRKFLVGYDRVLCDWRCWHHWWHCLCIYRWNQTECVFETVSLLYSLPQGWTSRKAPQFRSVQFSSVAQSCPTLWDPMNRSTPGLPVHHQLPEFTQTHVHRVADAIQPSHPLSSPSPPAPNSSWHQSLFQWVNFLHEVAKVLEFQL